MHFHHDTNCDKKFHVFYGVKSDLKLAQKCIEKYANNKKKKRVKEKNRVNEGKIQMNTSKKIIQWSL